MLSPRTAKYVEALRREGDQFDYWNWLQRVRDEEAQENSVPAVMSSGESPVLKSANPTGTLDRREARANSETWVTPKPAPVPGPLRRSDHEPRSETQETRLRRRLGKVSDACDKFQASRARDAVYGYLEAVFSTLLHYKVRRRTKRLLRHAFKFAGLPFDKNADPFATLIRCTCEQELDNKTISKWARALRYVAHCKVPRAQLKTFMKEPGGVNACAERYARYYGRRSE